MKKALAALLLSILCMTALFAYVRFGVTGVSETNTIDNSLGERFSLDLAGGTYWSKTMLENPGAHFSFLTEVSASAAFDGFHEGQIFHVDLAASILPGFTYVFGSKTSLSLSASLGVRAIRIGYKGDIKEANGWDKFVSIVSLGILGCAPFRRIDAVVDLRAKFGLLGAGVELIYPFLASGIDGYVDRLATSVFVTWGRY